LYGVSLRRRPSFLPVFILQILSDDSRDDSHGNTPIFVQTGYYKADIIFFARSAVIIAGVGHSIYAVGQADVDHTFVNIRNFAGIFVLDSALFQITMTVLQYLLQKR